MPGSQAMRREQPSMDASSLTQHAQMWMSAFGAALERGDIDAAARLFDDECYWRDIVAFTWNIKTMEGRSAIAAMLAATLARVRPRTFAIDGEAKMIDDAVEAWFTFETGVARGRGHVRLRNGRCWTLLTTMEALKGHEERRGEMRPLGAGHGVSRDAKTWLEARSQA